MAFESSMEPRNVAVTTRELIFTPSIEIPEKLPMDQLWRFTISASSANVTTSSVMAEQM